MLCFVKLVYPMLKVLAYGVPMLQYSEVLIMVEAVPGSIPHIPVKTVRKVERKPDFRNEKKYKERERQARRKKDQLSQSISVGHKGSNLDVLL